MVIMRRAVAFLITCLIFFGISLHIQGENTSPIREKLDSIASINTLSLNEKIEFCKQVEQAAKAKNNALGNFEARVFRANFYLEKEAYSNAQLLSSYLIYLLPSAILETDSLTELKYKMVLAEAHFIHAIANQNLSNGEDVLQDIHLAIDIFSQIGDSTFTSRLMLFLVNYYAQNNQPDSVNFYLERSIQNAESDKTANHRIATYLEIAKAYTSLDSALKALLYLDSAQNLSLKWNISEHDAIIHNYQANLHTKAGEFEIANELYKKSLGANQLTTYRMAQIKQALASNYLQLGLADSAKNHAEQALTAYMQEDRKYNIPEARIQLAIILNQLKQPEKALEILDQIPIRFIPRDSLLIRSLYHSCRASILLDLNTLRSSRQELILADTYIQSYERHDESKLTAYQQLLRVKIRLGQTENALETVNSMEVTNRNLQKQRNKYENAILAYRQILAINAANEALKVSEETHIKYLKDVKNIQMFLLICFIVGVIFFVFFVYRNKRHFASHFHSLKLRISEQQNTIVDLINRVQSAEKRVIEVRKEELYRHLSQIEASHPFKELLDRKITELKAKADLKEGIAELIIKQKDRLEAWDDFNLKISHIFPDFQDKLRLNYPHFTDNDVRLCSFLKLELTNKQIGAIASISDNTVKSSLFRLKKKMNLSEKDNLREVVLEI